jgi:hypothetical protein
MTFAITEDADDLPQHLQREHNGRKKVRLRRLSLRPSGQAQTRQANAPASQAYFAWEEEMLLTFA